MPATDSVTVAEACAVLHMTVEQLRFVMCGPNNPDLADHITIRQLLAARIAEALMPLVSLPAAVTTGVTAGHGAQAGGNRLLVVAIPTAGKGPQAFWRDADENFRTTVPFIGVPADAWFTALNELVTEHRRTAGRPH